MDIGAKLPFCALKYGKSQYHEKSFCYWSQIIKRKIDCLENFNFIRTCSQSVNIVNINERGSDMMHYIVQFTLSNVYTVQT